MLRNIGTPEILIVLAIVLLLFGARKLPELARSLGQSAKELRKGLQEGVDEEVPTDEGSKGPNSLIVAAPENDILGVSLRQRLFEC